MKINRYFLLLTTATFIYACSLTSIAETVVVVHPSNNESALGIKVVKKLFLVKTSSFPGGGKATPADQPEGSGIRSSFYKNVAGKNDAQMKSYWSKMIFSGKASPPIIVNDDAAIKSWVASNPNGIGYIDSSQVDTSVKVVLSIP